MILVHKQIIYHTVDQVDVTLHLGPHIKLYPQQVELQILNHCVKKKYYSLKLLDGKRL